MSDNNEVPNYIYANTVKLLREEMINNNTKYNKNLDYYAIQKDNLFWYAWFKEPELVKATVEVKTVKKATPKRKTKPKQK